jgi:hypothetical protein
MRDGLIESITHQPKPVCAVDALKALPPDPLFSGGAAHA